MKKLGIDVSYAQGEIDWCEVKKHGVEYAMLRAGYGAGNLDERFKRNAECCMKNGIPFGMYWFSYAYTVEMAIQEANYICDLADLYQVEYPLVFDWEYDSQRYMTKVTGAKDVGETLYEKMTRAFCDQVERRGYYAMFYANKDFLRRYGTGLTTQYDYDVWYACYGELDMVVNLQQFTSELVVQGIAGKVDGNYCYVDFPGIMRRAGLNKLKATP